jgi:translation initiation factor IF-2
MAPKDIDPDVPVKDSSRDPGSPKAPKPLSLSSNKGAQEEAKSPSLKPAYDAPAGPKPLSPGSMEKTPKMSKPPSPAATQVTPRSNRGKNPKKSSPSPSPQLYGLGAAGGVPTGGDSAWPRVRKMPQSSP